MPPDSSSRSQSSNGKFCTESKEIKVKTYMCRIFDNFTLLLKISCIKESWKRKTSFCWNKLETFVWVAL